jgi:hypothetical protein
MAIAAMRGSPAFLGGNGSKGFGLQAANMGGKRALLFLSGYMGVRRATEGRTWYWQDGADAWDEPANVNLDSKDD